MESIADSISVLGKIAIGGLILVGLLLLGRIFLWWLKNVVLHRLPRPFLGEGPNKEWAEKKRAELEARELSPVPMAYELREAAPRFSENEGIGQELDLFVSGQSGPEERQGKLEASIDGDEVALLRAWLRETGHIDDAWAEKLLGKGGTKREDLRNRMRGRAWLVAAQTLLGAALLAAWVWIVDIGAVSETLRQVEWGYVLLATGLGATSTLVRTTRWRLILRPVAQIPRLDIWLISLASSLINFVIPIRSGELARSLFLKQKHGVPISASLPTVAVDRSLDLLAVLVVGAFGAASGLTMEGPLSLVLLLGAGLFIAFFVFVLLAIFSQDRLMPLVERLVPRSFGKRFRDRLLGILNGLLMGFAAIGRKPRGLIPIVALSFGATILDAALFYALFLSVGAVLSPLVVLTGYALFVITFIVPGAPGYIGSMEAFGSLVFGALGVGSAVAASVIVLFHALSAIILALLGGLAIWALGLRPAAAFGSVVQGGEATTSAPATPGT